MYKYSPGTIITIDGTVIEILGYPATPFRVEARIPAMNAPINAAAAGGKARRSISSNRTVFDIAPIIPAAAARGTGLLNIIEKPYTPQKLNRSRRKIHCHNDSFKGRNEIGFKPNDIASIQAVMVATVMIIIEYISRSVPERMSNLARSIPLVINGKPGITNSIEQIYPASCCKLTENIISNNFSRAV